MPLEKRGRNAVSPTSAPANPLKESSGHRVGRKNLKVFNNFNELKRQSWEFGDAKVARMCRAK